MDFLLFFATLAPISLMPGINMTYAMSIGMSFGYKHSLIMMTGQLLSLAFVAFCCMLGVGAVLHHFEYAFKALNIIAGLYMLYLGAMLLFGKGELLKFTKQKADVYKRTHRLLHKSKGMDIFLGFTAYIFG